ncbi:MAG: DUF4397 domain-containing protein [Sphingobacteriaceae bacterium]|nr:MAG: DUF4397 domain-containing protein [Sphingobacteriaceae bacterium]
MKSVLHFYKLKGIIAFTLITCFLSCKTNVPTDTPVGNAHIAMINAAPGTAAINFYYTGNKINTIPLVYGNTTGYRNLISGSREIQIKANLTNKMLTANTVRLKQDSSYSFFVYEANNTITTAISYDDLSNPSVGNAKIRLVNLSAGLSSADLYITNGPQLSSSISFGSIGIYQELKAGTYNFDLRLHGSNNLLLNIPNVRLDNGKTYTMWSGGSVKGSGSTALFTQIIIQ